MNQYSEKAFGVAFRILNDEMAAEDVVQESFISIWKKIKVFDLNRSFSTWLYRIVVNRSYDVLRKMKKKQEVELDSLNNLIDSSNDPHVILGNKEIAELIRVLSDRLSPKQKLIFVLIELEECTHDEVVKITGLNKTTVKSNLNHARRNIAKRIESLYHEERAGAI